VTQCNTPEEWPHLHRFEIFKTLNSLYFYWLRSSFPRSKTTGIWSWAHSRLLSRLGICGAIPPLLTYLPVVHRNFRRFFITTSHSQQEVVICYFWPRCIVNFNVGCSYVGLCVNFETTTLKNWRTVITLSTEVGSCPPQLWTGQSIGVSMWHRLKLNALNSDVFWRGL